MGAAGGGSSLLLHVGLLGAGFVLGRVPLLSVAEQALAELQALPAPRKVRYERGRQGSRRLALPLTRTLMACWAGRRPWRGC